jgi:hypothetical protein
MLANDELQQLEATLLPTLERHHLRLLAHGLRSLQAAAGRRSGAPPAAEAIAAWLMRQPGYDHDPGFTHAFLTQLEALRAQLEVIAAGCGREPLALDLDDLCRWATAAGCDHHGHTPIAADHP